MTKREIRIEGDVAYIPLTQGYEALIDAADVHLVAGVSWRALIVRKKDGSPYTVYAISNRRKDGKSLSVLLHRLIAQPEGNLVVDHYDGDGLNNTRANLRQATRAENQRNQKMSAKNTSGFKGVYFHRKSAKWACAIHVDSKIKYLGLFASKDAAGAAYADASKKYHGEFGRVK